jgi:hypothetical protein
MQRTMSRSEGQACLCNIWLNLTQARRWGVYHRSAGSGEAEEGRAAGDAWERHGRDGSLVIRPAEGDPALAGSLCSANVISSRGLAKFCLVICGEFSIGKQCRLENLEEFVS